MIARMNARTLGSRLGVRRLGAWTEQLESTARLAHAGTRPPRGRLPPRRGGADAFRMSGREPLAATQRTTNELQSGSADGRSRGGW
jgi:hypothetical protein